MEIKRPDQITEADIPNIEYPFFASGRIERVFEGFGGQHLLGIRGLDEIVKEYMPRFLGRDQRKLSVYWAYYKSGGKERDRDYDFRRDDPVKDQVLEDFRWGKYLIVLQTDYELFRCCPLFRQIETPGVNPHDRWKQYGDALPSSDYMGFEGILNRIYPDRKRLDYHPFYGPSSGVGDAGEVAEEITLTPEPWPQENTTVLQTSLAAAAAQPAPLPVPNTNPTPKTTLPKTPPANDPVFNIKKGIRLTRVLGGIAGVILGVFIPDNASLEEEWEIDGVSYKYNTDDFSLEITNPDGSKEQVVMYPDGTVTDQQGAIMGSVKDGEFTPATEQEDVDFRVWKANGGEGSFAVWKNSGKPSDPSLASEASMQEQFTELKEQGHGPQRHEGDVTIEQLEKRCTEGIDPMSGTPIDAVTGRAHKYGRNATKVNTPADYVYADNYLRDSDEFKLKEKAFIEDEDTVIVVDETPLENIYGADYLTKIDGRSRIGSASNPEGVTITDFTNGKMKAVYRKNDKGSWDLITMYPEPN